MQASRILIALSSQQRIPSCKLLIVGSAFNIWHVIQQRMLCLEPPGRDRRAAQGGHKTYRGCKGRPAFRQYRSLKGGVSSRNKPAMSKRSRAGVRPVSETGFPCLSARCLPHASFQRGRFRQRRRSSISGERQLTPVFGQYVEFYEPGRLTRVADIILRAPKTTVTRPTKASKAAVRYVRSTSTPADRNAQIADIHGPRANRLNRPRAALRDRPYKRAVSATKRSLAEQ